MSPLARSSKNPLARWWWRMDQPTYILLFILFLLGAAISLTASGAVAGTYEVDPYYFARRQFIFLFAGFCGMTFLSFLSPSVVTRLGFLLFLGGLGGVISTFFMGVDVKGATRWIEIGGFSLQPTEFLKPGFIMVTAWLMAERKHTPHMKDLAISCILTACVCTLVLLQPNVSMVMLIGMVWGVQIFLAGVPILIFLPFIFVGSGALAVGYMMFPHVRERLERFLDPTSGDTYQVDQAREAFLSGGFFGRGAGEGIVKHHLPDAHTDFVFAVIGEEFGIIMCLLLLALYGWIAARGFQRILQRDNLFLMTAAGGLLTLFAFHALINAGVVLQVLPTTGMTLPFISYGGSSTLSMSITMGFLLALLKREEGESLKRKKRF